MENLKQAQKKKRINGFSKKRGADTPPADKERFDKTLGSMISGKPSKAPESSG
jgi:hypothetical protein